MNALVRQWKVAAAAALLAAGAAAAYVSAAPAVQVIRVVAKRFDYTPGEIRLKKGVPVVLEFTTQDVVMGFSAPDLDARSDILPGQVARVRLVPDKTGTFVFHCDIFCGSGHEDMSGTIVVSE
ncbi:MAG: soxH [Proteobacteria bacterium]|jgi:cytochrome c oxidase subunit 2|nr:soxH [Pseudomonadota bacterium]MBS1171903.1 soxH [Pseudomonadota bacterium]